jgi:hypothetical protein
MVLYIAAGRFGWLRAVGSAPTREPEQLAAV